MGWTTRALVMFWICNKMLFQQWILWEKKKVYIYTKQSNNFISLQVYPLSVVTLTWEVDMERIRARGKETQKCKTPLSTLHLWLVVVDVWQIVIVTWRLTTYITTERWTSAHPAVNEEVLLTSTFTTWPSSIQRQSSNTSLCGTHLLVFHGRELSRGSFQRRYTCQRWLGILENKKRMRFYRIGQPKFVEWNNWEIIVFLSVLSQPNQYLENPPPPPL